MTNSKQERFEREIMLECEMSNNGSVRIDNLTDVFTTLSEIQTEQEEAWDVRRMLYIIVHERMNRLSEFQRQLAFMHYVQDMSIQTIADETDRAKSTIWQHIQHINKVLRSV